MSPAGEAKVFCFTVQDSVHFLSSIYIECISLLVILPRLKCTQEETGYYTDKKEIKFSSYMYQNGAVAKPYRTNGFLIYVYGEIFAHFLIY
jgi:hypothetical protein